MESEVFYHIPLWQILLLLILLCLAVCEVCRKSGQKASAIKNESEHFNEILPTSVLGLLALLLGFTFSMALSRYDLRQSLVVKEANAIGTAYLRTQILEEPWGTNIRSALKEYTQHRVAFYPDFRVQKEAYQQRTSTLLNHLWDLSMKATKGQQNAVTALYLNSINEVIDTDDERTFANINHVPELVYYVIIIITLLGLGSLSYIAGFRSQRKTAFYILSVLFSIVVVLIMDLDRPSRGLIHINEQSLVGLLHSFSPPQ